MGIEPPPVQGKSIFDDESYYSRTGWNLNLLPHMHASLLKHLKANISGVNIPWLYVGMLFSTFCWHNEDNYLYSINYSHEGSCKQWYGVPGASTAKLEQVRNFHGYHFLRQRSISLCLMIIYLMPIFWSLPTGSGFSECLGLQGVARSSASHGSSSFSQLPSVTRRARLPAVARSRHLHNNVS